MRAGSLDRSITVQRLGEVRDPFGGVSAGWSDLATVRAQVLQSATDEFMQAGGEQAARAVAFRIRWIDGLRNADRVVFEGLPFDVLEVKEIGRRRGLELRCRGASS